MKIILDNGHGGNTPGKRSPVWPDGTQLMEFEFNRNIVKRIKNQIPDAIVLVPEIIDITLPDRVWRANKIWDANGQKDCILISVHGNAGGGTGFEVWTSPGQTKSDEYATKMFNAMKALLPVGFPMRKDLSDGDVDKEENFYILSKSKCPAILTENLFYDTEKDYRFMQSEEGRQLIAQAHINFIKSIL